MFYDSLGRTSIQNCKTLQDTAIHWNTQRVAKHKHDGKGADVSSQGGDQIQNILISRSDDFLVGSFE